MFASPVPSRSGGTGVFPACTASLFLSLVLAILGGGWMFYLAGASVASTPTDRPIGFSVGEVVVLSDPGHLLEFACGDRRIDTADLALCDPGQPLHIRFTYSGHRLWLQLQRGDEFGLLFVTVDGQPANLIKVQAAIPSGEGARAGRLPLYSPYEHASMRPASEWIPVHRDNAAHSHTVELQVHPGPVPEPLSRPGPPVLAVGVDLPSPVRLPYWPGLLFLIVGGIGLALALLAVDHWPTVCRAPVRLGRRLLQYAHAVLPTTSTQLGLLAGLGLLAVSLGPYRQSWGLSLLGLAMLGLAGFQRPAIWLGAVLLGLPFYLFPLPLFPGFALNLVEIGVWGGLMLVGLQYLRQGPDRLPEPRRNSASAPVWWSLAAFTGVALFSAWEAQYQAPALREWRTVFLAALVFLTAVAATLRMSARPAADAALMLSMWIGGAVAVSLFGYYAFTQGIFVTDVDGVRRIRGLFGSPNNLALYLERTVLVSIALFLFARTWPRRLLWAALVAVQAGALLLTFSKGGLLLGLPAGLLVLAGATYCLRRRLPEARRVIGLLGGVALVGLLLLAPFLNTPRFAGLWDWQQHFPSFVRIHLWRSGLQMFLDHWLGGIGPDNFLYWYRGAYLHPAVWHEPSLNHPHNFLLDLVSRLGLAGLGAGLAFFGIGFRALWRQIGKPAPSRVALGLAAAGVAGLAHGLVDASYALPELMLIWTLLFGLACMPHLAQTARMLT